MTPSIRVVIVDDHPIVRSGLRALLDTIDGIQVVADAGTAADALRAVALHRPDVAVIDIGLPDTSGIEVMQRIAARHPATAVLALTMNDDEVLVRDALAAGARGYVLKGSDHGTLVRAVLDVAAGATILGPGVSPLHASSEPGGQRPFPQLTDRELEVLSLVSQSLDNAAVARRLSLSTKTVRNHLSNILVKIHARDRAEAILAAREAGLHR